MSLVTFGDLAQSLAGRVQSSRLRSDLSRLSTELTTGRTQDAARHIGGDTTALSALDRSLARLTAERTTLSEAALQADVTQSAIGTISDEAAAAASDLAAAVSSGTPRQVDLVTQEARDRFLRISDALNTRVAGRSVFSGTATDRAAVATGSDMLALLKTAVTGLTTAGDISAAVDTWFAPGGGFDSSGYQGAAARGRVPLPGGGAAQVGVTAQETAIRETLAGLAKAALVAEGVLDGYSSARSALASEAGADLFNARDSLTQLQAALGAAQASVTGAEARRTTEVAALQISRADLVGLDPYETASRLKQAETQLDTLYAVTARLSGLSLTRYL